ncbi:MAG: PfkB family carbohydrate kinase [Spirochaetia bacterium]|nr:PfkB family carbohydrate kinase [Spirochaetia bacterium]
MGILVAGTVALDDVKTPFGKREKILGGSASHFSMAASFLAPVQIVSVIGNDFPKAHLDYLAAKKIDTSGIEVSEEKTFHWKGHYEYDMNVAHTDETILGVLTKFNPNLKEAQKNFPFLFLANIDPEIQMKVVNQMTNLSFVGLDSMNFWIESKQKSLWDVLKKADALFLNDAEIRELAQEASLIKAAKIVQKNGPKIVLVKKGEHGVLTVTKDFVFVAAAYPTEEVKDPTGAGDSFAGGFTSYLYSQYLQNKDNIYSMPVIKKAVIWGAAAASFCVEEFTTEGLEKTSIEQIKERCHDIHEFTSFEKH